MRTTSPWPHDRAGLRLPTPVILLWIGLLSGCEPSSRQDTIGTSLGSDGMLVKANRIISSALSDPDPRIRTNAIEVVASTRQLRFGPAVRRLLRDPVVPVRFAALLAIGDLRYAVARPDVQQIFDETREDPNIRLAAAYALCRLGATPYADYARKVITTDNQTVRANAALILGKTGDTLSLDALYWAIQDSASDDRVLDQALESIAMLGDHRILQKVFAKLISAYADDRIAAIRAMGALGGPQASGAILTMLEDGVVEVRLAAAEQLGRLHNPTGEKKVLEALHEHDLSSASDAAEGGGPSRVKVLAALAIGEIGSERLVRALPGLLDDRSRFVQVAAAKAVLIARERKPTS